MNGFQLLAESILNLLIGPTSHGIGVWFLVCILTWSGIAKLRQPDLAAMAMVHFGVVRHFYPLFGKMLGIAEVLLAVVLGLGLRPSLFLTLTSAMLWLFVLLIAHSLVSGKQFACSCFGSADSMLSGWTLIRTVALALLASMLIVTMRPVIDHQGLNELALLHAIAALSLLGTIVLSSYIRPLLQWNSHSLRGSIAANKR